LIFFILTLQIAPAEGDLALQLPRGRERIGPPPDCLPLDVDLSAGSAGALAEVRLNGRRLKSMDELHQSVASLLADDAALAAVTEVRLHCDEDLAYVHAVAAVTAVSGRRLPDGKIQPLATKVRFVERPR
jgi:hypothetical protein